MVAWPANSSPTPRRGVGNPAAEEHIETVGACLRDERRRGCMRQVAQDDSGCATPQSPQLPELPAQPRIP